MWKGIVKNHLLIALLGSNLVASTVATTALPIGGPNEEVPDWVQNRNLNTTKKFFQSWTGIADDILNQFRQGKVPQVPSAIPGWASSIRGQISPFGAYKDYARSAEYFFSMPAAYVMRASIAQGGFPFQGYDRPSTGLGFPKVVITRLSSSGNMVTYEARFFITAEVDGGFAAPLPGRPTFTQQGTLFFNKESEICGYDVQVRHVSSLFAGPQSNDALREAGFPAPEVVAQVPDSPFKDAYLPREGSITWIEEICDIATGSLCSGVGKAAYESKEACIDALSERSEGSYGDIDQDNLVCRALHRLLVPGSPHRHCLHLAASLSEEQGGTCIDRNSEDYEKRKYQCGYDNVGYVEDDFWTTQGYPESADDLESKWSKEDLEFENAQEHIEDLEDFDVSGFVEDSLPPPSPATQESSSFFRRRGVQG